MNFFRLYKIIMDFYGLNSFLLINKHFMFIKIFEYLMYEDFIWKIKK